jgi:subtilisin
VTVLEEPETPTAEDNTSSGTEPEITPEDPTGNVMSVSSLTATKEYSIKGKNTFGWAVATVKIVDRTGKAVPGATVSGSWSGLTTALVSGTTDTNGIVKFTSSQVKNPKGMFTFKLTGTTCTGYTYDPSQNICSITSVTF